MADTNTAADKPVEGIEPLEAFQLWSRLWGRAQQHAYEFWIRQVKQAPATAADPLGIFDAWGQVASRLMANPERLVSAQAQYFTNSMKLWQDFALYANGGEAAPANGDADRDKRFASKEWHENLIFDFIRQSYLMTAHYLQNIVAETQGLDPKTKAKAEFYTRQFIDAAAPSNFLLTNPEALKATLESGGQNLVNGLDNLLSDLERGRISMTDEAAFEIGRNVAATPGAVVFENEYFQLIQYAPTTPTAHEIPLVIFPPWINKFYILDLTEKKSFVKYCLDQGVTVFMVSWVNADSSMRDRDFADYVRDGELKAVEVAREICGTPGVNVIGYCVAGTALAALLGYLHGTGRQSLVRSATFFTAQVDFAEAGDLCVFVDPAQLELIDQLTEEQGYLDASHMATTFNLLRANDLIWSYVVNNYLLGKDPFPFDLLYWNSDATRLPRAMHLYYLKNMYQENNLVKPGALKIGGVPIDLGRVETPVFIQAGKEDHIAPARSVYKMTQLFKGPRRFVLAGSGHVAGVVNPPAANKYQHWISDSLPPALSDFIAGATERPGSWWPDWLAWLAPHLGASVPSRTPGATPGYPAIEPAPGRYVKVKA